MSTGNADGYFEFFPVERIPDSLRLVLDTWPKVRKANRLEKEDSITERLAAAIKREKKARRSWFSIHFQVVPLDDQGAVRARIDFKFLAGYDEDAYFAFECKRLRIPRPKKPNKPYLNTSKYVNDEGMGRFISGKYSSTQEHGAMIAYVMDGDAVAAKASVLDLIVASQKQLRLESGDKWEPSSFLPDEQSISQTRHILGKGRHFAIQHIFLPL